MDQIFILGFILIMFAFFGLVLMLNHYKDRSYSKMYHNLSNLSSSTQNTDILTLNLNRTEFYKALNFMMMFGIISFEQYTEIESKALPYLRP